MPKPVTSNVLRLVGKNIIKQKASAAYWIALTRHYEGVTVLFIQQRYLAESFPGATKGHAYEVVVFSSDDTGTIRAKTGY